MKLFQRRLKPCNLQAWHLAQTAIILTNTDGDPESHSNARRLREYRTAQKLQVLVKNPRLFVAAYRSREVL